MKSNSKHVNIPVSMDYVEMYVPKNVGVQWEFKFCEVAPEQVVKNLLTLSAKQDINDLLTDVPHLINNCHS